MALLVGFMVYMIVCSWIIYKAPLLYQTKDCRKDRQYIAATLGVLLLMACLRGIEIGNDTSSYYVMFRYYSGISNIQDLSLARILWLENIEIGYRYLNYIVSCLTNNYQIFLSIIASFSYLIVMRFIRRYSSNVCLSCLLFFLMFYGVYMNLFRQVLAVSIILLAFDWLNKEKYIVFGTVVFVAALFHRTALVALLLIPMTRFRSRKIVLWILVVIDIVIVALGQIPIIMSLLGISTSYTDVTAGMSVLFSAVLNIILLFASQYLMQRGWTEDVCYEKRPVTMLNSIVARNLVSWIPYVCLLFSILAFAMPVATRFELYFSVLYLVVLPEMIVRCMRNSSNKRIILNFLIFVFAIYIAGKILYRPEWVTEYDYSFFWQDR